jgi:hypothetical protein
VHNALLHSFGPTIGWLQITCSRDFLEVLFWLYASGERRKWDQAAVLWPRLPVAASHEAVWSRSGVLGHLLLAPTRLSGAPW